MFDDCDAFADFLDDFHLMSNHDDCDIQLLIDVFQKLEDGFYSFRIKCACRFIRKQYRGVGYDGSCNADSLLLSAGKLGRILVLVAGKPYKFKDVINPFFLFRFRHIGKFKRESNILGNGSVGEKVEMLENHSDVFAFFAQLGTAELCHILPVDDDLSGRRRFKHIDAADEC